MAPSRTDGSSTSEVDVVTREPDPRALIVARCAEPKVEPRDPCTEFRRWDVIAAAARRVIDRKPVDCPRRVVLRTSHLAFREGMRETLNADHLSVRAAVLDLHALELLPAADDQVVVP